MPAENQPAAPRGTDRKGDPGAPASGGTNGRPPALPVRDKGAQSGTLTDSKLTDSKLTAAADPNNVDGLLRIVRSVGQALILIGNVTKHEAPTDNVLRAIYIVVQEGEHAIDAVKNGTAADETTSTSVSGLPALPEWPKAGASDAPGMLQTVWDVLQPWLGELVEHLPGSNRRQQAIKRWAANCLGRKKDLVDALSKALNNGPTLQKAETS